MSSLRVRSTVFRFAMTAAFVFFFSTVWGPAAFSQDESTPTPDEIENMGDPNGLPSTDGSPIKKTRKKSGTTKKKPIARSKAKMVSPSKKPGVTQPKVGVGKKKAVSQSDDDELEAEPTPPKNEPESIVTEERDPVRRGSNAREMAVRVVGLGKISVLPVARKFVPKDLELRLFERLMQDLGSKTYFEPQGLDGAFDLRTRAAVLAAASKKAGTDGVLVFEIGLEEIKGYLASASGLRIRTFDFKYRLGELDEKNVVSILTDRLIDGVVQAIPYRGFVTAVDKTTSTATVNLGSSHAVKEGDVLELFEFRRPDFNSTRKLLLEVQIKKVLGPSESQVGLMPGASKGTPIEPFAKVGFALAGKTVTNTAATVVEATDQSVVSGRWWFGFGGELDSLGAEAAAEKYESKVFKINGAPFGYAALGNDVLTMRAAFGSGRSDTETLNFFDVQGTYVVYQFGGAQSAWTIGAGGRVFLIQVSPNPGVRSALESTTIVSPMAEFKYQYVPKGRIRLVGTGEVFWPVYTNGAAIGALPFAFGAGLGAGMQIAITPKFGFEVFGKVRYLRRPIDGQSGIQERQSMLGTGLLFSF